MQDIGEIFTGDDVRMLAELGYAAISRGFDKPAEILFRGVTAARPAGEAGPIGRALVHLYRGEVDAAVAILKPLPPSDAVRLFLGMALARRGDRAEAGEILSDLATHSADAPEGRGARQILDSL